MLDKIERIARSMCIADGLDPDEIVSGPGPNEFALQAKDFNSYAVCSRQPAWRKYQRRANLLLAGLKEIDLMMVGG